MISEQMLIAMKRQLTDARDQVLRAKTVMEGLEKSIQESIDELKKVDPTITLENIEEKLQIMEAQIQEQYTAAQLIMQEWHKKLAGG